MIMKVEQQTVYFLYTIVAKILLVLENSHADLYFFEKIFYYYIE